MKFHLVVCGMAGVAASMLAWAPGAEARNPSCAGGIQYVVQAMRDKDKGDLDAYNREINKAVQQLNKCAAEDTLDYEAIGYLGWALAEVESAGPAGRAFDQALRGLTAKGDKKKVEWANGNRASYWARWYNDGIAKIQAAQQAYPDFCKKAENEADQTLRSEAEKRYQEAEASLTKATMLVPSDARNYRSLGSVYAFQCQYTKAENVFRSGLRIAPTDTTLQQATRNVRVNYANQLVEEKKYDEAIAFYSDLVKAEPSNPEHHISLADVHFRRAQALEGDARKADFKAAADGYAQAAKLKPADGDLPFNAALAYQNAGAWEQAETMWRAAVQVRPDDIDALSSLGATLVELNKCDAAVQTLHQAVTLKPQNKTLHRQLGAIYTKCGNNAKATEELMVYLSLQNGQPVADAAAHAKGATGAAAKTLSEQGPPEQVIPWEADNQKYETWLYWNKKVAFTFNSGTLVTRSDWSAPVLGGKPTAAGSKK